MKDGDKAQIIIVFELPPRAVCRIRVNADSRYGTTSFFALPIALSANVEIHWPSTVKLLLIAQPSFSLSPVAPV